MKQRLQSLVRNYRDMLPQYTGKARTVLENVIEDIQQLIDSL